LMNVNCDGVFYGSKHVIPAMIESGGGSIVNISSLMGIIGATPGHWAYYASKGAVRNLTKAIAVKYGPQGIRANSVHPGFMQPMTTSRPGTGVPMDQILSQTPLGRVGDSIEVANAVRFLASD